MSMSDLAYWPAAKPLSKKDKFAKNRDFIAVSYTHLTLPTTMWV